MTRDDIIRMAREAGFSATWPETVPNFERFAALVAAAERDIVTLAAFQVAERQVAAEREACAAICDRIASPLPGESLEGWREGYCDGAGACRNLIRARGEK